jgi:hypothetical protein
MTDSAARPDLTMEAITSAMAAGGRGDTAAAQRSLLAIWDNVGASGDPLHRCTLAHYLADLYDDPAQALTWDVRALDAADALTEERTQQHHASLHVAGFYPSLHLNLADNYRRLSSFGAAADHIAAARRHAPDLPAGPYGELIRRAIEEVGADIAQRVTRKRASAPGPPA